MKEFEAGQVIDIPAQGCLGLLAAGARGVAAWRRVRDGAGAMPAVQFGQPPQRRNTGKSRVLLIGWDAADWKLINPLIDAGLMPAMDRLVSGGVVGNLATITPPPLAGRLDDHCDRQDTRSTRCPRIYTADRRR